MANERSTSAREAMPALDPRLELLLSLPAKELEALHAREARQLRAVERQILALAARVRDPDLRAAERARVERELRQAWTGLFAPFTAGVRYPQRGGEAWFSLFLLSEAGADDLRAAGARVRSRAGDVHTALVPRSAVPGLVESGAVRYAELARALFPDLATALSFAGIDALHAVGVTGKGVALAVVDDGIDWTLSAFRDGSGKTRIDWLWDQTLTPQAGESGPPVGSLPGFMPSGGATYGVEYAAADIDAELAGGGTIHHQPGAGHGTSVAWCAAGADGAAPGTAILFARPLGVAESELLLDSVHTADAFAWAFARAELAGLPCVANMSRSSGLGPHDGTSLLELYLDDLLAVPGRAITLSAGNSTDWDCHARGAVADEAPAQLVLTYAPPVSGEHRDDAAEIWYGGHERFGAKVTIEDPPGSAIGTLSASPGDPVQTLTLANGAKVALASRLAYPGNGDNWIRLDLGMPPGELAPARFVIELQAQTPVLDGRFHAWVEYSNSATSDWLVPATPEEEITVGTPGTARRAVTVGAHSKLAGGTPTILSSSGVGPTRDGRTKPELAATGDALAGVAGATFSGTSAAAPLVAGACALLFECRGKLSTWADLKQVLVDTAGLVPASPAPDKAFGMGYLQVESACSAPAPEVDVWLRDDAGDTGVEPSTGPVFWACPDIELLDVSGAPIAKPVHDPSVTFTTRVRVTARNRGSSPALSTEVFLYWADPATNIPFPGAWRSEGILVDRGGAPALGNRAAVQRIAPGASAQVEFLWQPPAPGSGSLPGGHFCLLARIENGADPSLVGAGGWTSVTARNNVGLHNVHVVEPSPSGTWTYSFAFAGTGDESPPEPGAARDALLVRAYGESAALALTLPVQALPWRELAVLRAHGGSLPRPGRPLPATSPLATRALRLEGPEVEARTEVRGARELVLRDGLATLVAGEGAWLALPRLRLEPGLRVRAWLAGRVRRGGSGSTRVHVAQRSAGRPVGGITVLLGR